MGLEVASGATGSFLSRSLFFLRRARMMKHFGWRFGTGLLCLIGLALAQASSDIRLDLKAFRVVSVQEQSRTVERLEPALDAKPGQIIQYQLTALNTFTSPLRQVALVIPIPPPPPTRPKAHCLCAWEIPWLFPSLALTEGKAMADPPSSENSKLWKTARR